MQVTTAHPVAIDTEIARINKEIAGHELVIERSENNAERWSKSHMADYYADRIAEAKTDAEEARKAVIRLHVEAEPLHVEFERRGGWTRWYLVEDGHLHNDVSAWRCSRIATTSHYWMVELSGKDEEEVIELAGERVCTTCFPAAPVSVLNRPSKLLTASEADRAEAARQRQQAREEKAKKAAAKGITDPTTGGPLVVVVHGHRETIKTQRAAEIELVSQLWYQKFYSNPEHREDAVRLLLAALAAKKGTTATEELAAAQKRLVARIKREG